MRRAHIKNAHDSFHRIVTGQTLHTWELFAAGAFMLSMFGMQIFDTIAAIRAW